MPGEVHELHHPAGESQPSIVVHTAIVQEEGSPTKQNIRAIPTKCPERA